MNWFRMRNRMAKNAGLFHVEIGECPEHSSQSRVTRPIVHSDAPLTLVGGGVTGPGDLGESLALAPRLVAADGGGDVALAAGYRPEAVIGDLDSLSAEARATLGPAVHRIAEQETTDFDKALRSIAAPVVIAVGMTGGRFDHDLAALNVLVRQAQRRCVLLGSESLVFLTPPEVRLPLAAGETVSLFPMGPCRARGEGLFWPLDGLELTPWGRVATSNSATGPVTIRVDAPRLLVILGRGRLREVVETLSGPGPRWD